MLNVTVRRLLLAGVLATCTSLLLAPAAAADHGGPSHNGETMELSKSEDISDGESVTVMVSSFLPGNTVTVLTCYNFPVAGPGDCDFSNMGQYTATVGDDGTAAVEYTVNMVPGRCDAGTACYIVASDGIGPSSNSAAQQFTFAATAMAEPEPEPTEAPAPTTTAAPPTTAAPVPTTTAAPPTTAAPESEPVEETAAPAAEADSDGGGSVWGWLLPVIIVVAVLALIGILFARRRAAKA